MNRAPTTARLLPRIPALTFMVLTSMVAACVLVAAPRTADAAVRAEVRVIHATGGAGAGTYVDPALKPIAGYLTKSFGSRYTAFRQLDRQTLALELKQRGTMDLPNDRTLALTFKGVTDGFVRLFMELPHLKTTVKIRDGGLFFQAGQSHKGGMLILAIKVHLR